LSRQTHGNLALNAFTVQEALNREPEESYGTALKRLVRNRTEFDKQTRRNFTSILKQVAQAANGISTVEKELLKRCRRDIAQI
jgi:hypothetical protein